ncbi:MAG: NAD-dependent epimerase/dehydratase family protein [Planctomycetota bacterium]
MSNIRVGVTGANGFIGQHLLKHLEQSESFEASVATRETFASPGELSHFARHQDCIVHFAGMNRGDDDEIYRTNVAITRALIDALDGSPTVPHVVFASSTHRDTSSAYGRSKAECEALLEDAAGRGILKLTTLVIPGVFGPGCRPFYNSVVATFCHQIANGETCEVHQDQEVHLISVHRLVEVIAGFVPEAPAERVTHIIEPMNSLRVSELLVQLQVWHEAFSNDDVVPDLSDPFDAHLYATLLSYIAPPLHAHQPTVHADERGRLFEIIKLANGGQVFFSTTKPGVVRGNHYHTRKIEWFCVLQGQARIRLREIRSEQIHEFDVCGERPQFVSIPALYTHNIENTGSEDLLTMFWCNEIFDASNPDTIYEKVA